MGVPQGSLIDLQFYDNLIDSVNEVQTCEELQAIAADALASITDAQTAIALEMAKVQPMLALLVAPSANLTQIVTYITDLITLFITPMVKPTITYAAQLATMTAKIAELAAAIQAASDRITDCNVPFP